MCMLKLHHNHLFRHSHPGLMKCSLIKPSNKYIEAEGNITALHLNTWVVFWGGEGGVLPTSQNIYIDAKYVDPQE